MADQPVVGKRSRPVQLDRSPVVTPRTRVIDECIEAVRSLNLGTVDENLASLQRFVTSSVVEKLEKMKA